MKLQSLIFALAAVLFCLPSVARAGKADRSRIEVEVVPSGVRGFKVDLFTLISNPNDFDVYVGPIGGSTVATEGQTIFGDGFTPVGRSDFLLVPAKSKRLQQLQLGYQLKEGLNHFKVRLSGGIDPNAKLPSNYVPFGTHTFEFTISTDVSK
jgi:hypothetical protein